MADIKNEFFLSVLTFRNFLDKLYFVQVIVYTCAAFWVLHRFRSKSEKIYKVSKWLKQILVLFLLVWVLFLMDLLIESTIQVSSLLNLSGILGLILLSNAILVLLFSSPEIFYNTLLVNNKKEITNSRVNKEAYDSLCDLVIDKKLYKNPNLRIDDLSDEVNESARTVSILINTYYKGNFRDFINTYRVEEAKSLLRDSSVQKTILAILYESGFNSKSVFNAVFKNKVGETPSSYRSKHMHFS